MVKHTSELEELAERTPEHHPQFGWYWNCPFCKDYGFDLRGLAHHVWMHCEVVEKLAEEDIEDVRKSNQEFHEAMVRQDALRNQGDTNA